MISERARITCFQPDKSTGWAMEFYSPFPSCEDDPVFLPSHYSSQCRKVKGRGPFYHLLFQQFLGSTSCTLPPLLHSWMGLNNQASLWELHIPHCIMSKWLLSQVTCSTGEDIWLPQSLFSALCGLPPSPLNPSCAGWLNQAGTDRAFYFHNRHSKPQNQKLPLFVPKPVLHPSPSPHTDFRMPCWEMEGVNREYAIRKNLEMYQTFYGGLG